MQTAHVLARAPYCMYMGCLLKGKAAQWYLVC
jgi:hypothetical protein